MGGQRGHRRPSVRPGCQRWNRNKWFLDGSRAGFASGTHREGPRASSPRVIAPSRGCTELLDNHVVRALRVDRRVSRVVSRACRLTRVVFTGTGLGKVQGITRV